KKRTLRESFLFKVVELAGIEPASRKRQPLVLHA
ncbi:MAG: hypothetical protein ACI94Z_000225, partial [Yoonia sp.]